MMRRSFISTLLILCISLGTVLSISGQSEYVTTITEYSTTVISTLKTEILENTVTITITQTLTSPEEVETHKTVLQPTMVLTPTQVMVTERQTVTKYVTDSDGSVKPVQEVRMREVPTIRFLTTIANVLATITSTKTTTDTITLTTESTTVSKITQSKTEEITITLENVYTSTRTSAASPTTQEQFTLSSLFSDYLPWILFIVAVIVAIAFAFLLRRSKLLSRKEVPQFFCINCGKPIEAQLKICPKCGEKQTEE